MIIVIRRMGANTGHVLLLLYWSYFQLVYDIFCFTSNVNCGLTLRIISYVVHSFTGIVVSVLSNWMAYIALYIVFFRQKFDVFGNINAILASSIIPGIGCGLFYFIAAMHAINNQDDLVTIAVSDIYNNLRLASIFLNFLFVAIILYKIELISSKMTKQSPQETAIRTLAYRMIYYPIIQAIARSGYAWWELQYGAYMDYHDATTEQYVCLIYLSIITPIASLGYLVILVVMQPQAYDHCKALLLCQAYDDIESKQSIISKNSLRIHFSIDEEDRISDLDAVEAAIEKKRQEYNAKRKLLRQRIKNGHGEGNNDEEGDDGDDEEGKAQPTISALPSTMVARDTLESVGSASSFLELAFRPSNYNPQNEEMLYYILEHPSMASIDSSVRTGGDSSLTNPTVNSSKPGGTVVVENPSYASSSSSTRNILHSQYSQSSNQNQRTISNAVELTDLK